MDAEDGLTRRGRRRGYARLRFVVVATNEPRRIACGAPDFNISRKGVPLGHVETKDVGISLDEMERGKAPMITG